METPSGMAVDRKVLIAMLLISLALAGGFALLYVNLNANFSALQDNYANLSGQMQQLQQTLQALKSNKTSGLTAVQIYNLTRYSVVLIANRQYDAFGDLVTAAEGSGFVYDMQGRIVTNNHVVEGAYALRVTFWNGTVADAQLVGRDPYSDLAVIQVTVPEGLLRPLHPGDSSALRVGETVYAIGSPFGLVGSITQGIVSQVGRSIRPSGIQYAIVDVTQIDAAINPGNSGGPLLDSFGSVVGVNFAIATQTGEFSGVGFALSTVIMQRVVPALIAKGAYIHPWVGIGAVDMSADIAEAMHTSYSTGALIISVNSSSPAEAAGLQGGSDSWTVTVEGNVIPLGGDIIIGVDAVQVKKTDDLLTYIERYKSPGDTITLTIVRDNSVLNKTLTLGERP